MEKGYSLSNLFKNMTKNQKIGVLIAIAIIVILIIISASLMAGGEQIIDGAVSNSETEQSEDGTSVEEETYVNDEGYTVTKEITTYADGGKIITETKEDEYGNVTTVDPSLITTYFPYQVMRKHTSEDLLDSGFEYTLRYSLSLDEEAKVINATIEFCDVEGDKALVQEYINSIPLDLSAYTVNYETFAEDAFCEA